VQAVHDVRAAAGSAQPRRSREPETRLRARQHRGPHPPDGRTEDHVVPPATSRPAGEDRDVHAFRDQLSRQLVELPLGASADVRPAVRVGQQDTDGELQRESVLSMLSRWDGHLTGYCPDV
jgi:hypothetical protein